MNNYWYLIVQIINLVFGYVEANRNYINVMISLNY